MKGGEVKGMAGGEARRGGLRMASGWRLCESTPRLYLDPRESEQPLGLGGDAAVAWSPVKEKRVVGGGAGGVGEGEGDGEVGTAPNGTRGDLGEGGGVRGEG